MANAARETLYLVDGTYSVFRSFYAISRLSAPDGTPTNGVFGFLSTMRKLIRDRSPDHLAVAFDVEGPTHRDELFAQYKANRPPPPADLVPQFALAMQAARAMGWPVLTLPGFEADDILATLARRGREAGLDIVIVTSDKDLYQLVGDGIVVQNPAKDDRVLDPAGVDDVFGVPPQAVVDVLALMGDAADNVPGVPGVGEKTAKSVVRRYGPVEEVLARAALFRTAWDAREQAIAALDGGDGSGLADALSSLGPAARALADLERQRGGEEAGDLVARFSAAAGLTPQTPLRALRRALVELEKKTQPKVWLSLADHAEKARFSRVLVTVRTDAPVDLELATLRRGPPDRDAALALFRRLGFRQFAEGIESEFTGGGPPSGPAAGADGARRPGPGSDAAARGGAPSWPGLFDAPTPEAGDPGTEPAPASVVEVCRSPVKVTLVDTPELLSVTCEELSRAETIGIRVVSDRPRSRGGRLVGLALSAGGQAGWYLPVAHRGGVRQLAWGAVHGPLQKLLGRDAPGKAGGDLRGDRGVLRRAGVTLEGFRFDPFLAARLLEPDAAPAADLTILTRLWLGENTAAADERAEDAVPAANAAPRAVEQAAAALRLVAPMREALVRDGLDGVYDTIEMPLVPVLDEMEGHGVLVDAGRLSAMSVRMDEDLAALEAEIHTLAGRTFNVNSPPQLRTILFDELKLQPSRRTQKTRALSTSQEVLESLADEHPLPSKILEYRELAKLKGTYLDALPRLIDPGDGRVHTHFNQIGAATGRLSSTDPNLQNIPVRTPAGRAIRAAFVPEPGWLFVSADYSQMELRLLAHLSGDTALIEVFERGLDVHRATAARVAGIELDRVTPALRAAAKAVNFGIVYGMSEFRLAREQGMTVDDARAFIAAYFERYPGVRSYIADTERHVQETGEVRTLYGRVRRFPDLVVARGPSRLTRPAREALLRQAVNATVQGTGADIVKLAMAAVVRRVADAGSGARLLLQVHDELLFEVPADDADTVIAVVREAMEGVANLAVPLKVDARAADSWAEAH